MKTIPFRFEIGAQVASIYYPKDALGIITTRFFADFTSGEEISYRLLTTVGGWSDHREATLIPWEDPTVRRIQE